MHSLLIRSACVLAFVLTAGMANPGSAQTTPDLETRCTQLISYFDRYGASRSLNSDGRRNHTRIGASIDCERGRHESGIATMEDLLRRKKFTVPPPPPAGVPWTPEPDYED